LLFQLDLRCEIWGSECRVFEDLDLQAYDAVPTDTELPKRR